LIRLLATVFEDFRWRSLGKFENLVKLLKNCSEAVKTRYGLLALENFDDIW
jgi:hypothetical protein